MIRVFPVLTDGTHLWCADADWLHRFARSIGLRREWMHEDGRFGHYDLLGLRMKRKAVRAGAQLRSTRQIVLAARRAKKEEA